ncbi:GFA domain-containing protein [Mycena indigotica]|uniref:GFA domain-containing protein n=1 Tax=Mycena indigotica TaxID=2126181 RepID=A0A8H6TIK5_9AGAR|nr:GFA domain-containing protein [Mycena indigotica]KAF7316390.1 GFA domain-containing protein [Mycena indigotica]
MASFFPLASGASDGWSTDNEATATCFCGDVQLAFTFLQPTQAPGLVTTFICHCSDCRKITASMFASNFTIDDRYLRHIRGQENLQTFSQSHTIGSGQTMTNFFCGRCGSLMYRRGAAYPGFSVLRIGTVDDFHLHETKLRPRLEQYTKTRVGWLRPVEGMKQFPEMAYRATRKRESKL